MGSKASSSKTVTAFHGNKPIGETLPLVTSRLGLNAILRGCQLSFVGAYRALQNPDLFTHQHYRLALFAVAAGVILYILLLFPLLFIRASVWASSLFVGHKKGRWDDDLIDAVNFIEHHVLALPFLIMTVIRHAYPKPLDDLFMQSLAWSDTMYVEKHALDDKTKQPLRPLYHKSLALYGRHSSHSSGGFSKFVHRTVKRILIGTVLYIVSLLPVVGRFVFPAAGFYSLYRALGQDLVLAAAVGGVGFLLLPKHTYVILVQGWLSSRALTRELLEPYFARITYSDSQKREWFHDREGVLLGFGLAFYMAVRLPLIGPLAYGIATASAAFLLTKITDPPPSPVYSSSYAASQVKWANKMRVLDIPSQEINPVERKKEANSE